MDISAEAINQSEDLCLIDIYALEDVALGFFLL
jgi:hypothetical protein